MTRGNQREIDRARAPSARGRRSVDAGGGKDDGLTPQQRNESSPRQGGHAREAGQEAGGEGGRRGQGQKRRPP